VDDESKSKEQLIDELNQLRQQLTKLQMVKSDQNISRNNITPLLYGEDESTGIGARLLPHDYGWRQDIKPKGYKFSDLIDIQNVQKFMNAMYNATGMMHAILDADNNILTANGWQGICGQFHRVCPQTEDKCKQSDSFIADHLQDNSYIGYQCLNGLMDYSTPIIVEGQHLATIFLGQVLHELPDEEYFRRQARQFGFDEAAYMEALKKVPIIPQENTKYIMDFYVQLAQLLAAMGLERKLQLEAAAAARRLSGDKFYKAFRNSPDIITISTLREGRFVEVNDAFLEISGYERTEVINHTHSELDLWVDPTEREQMLEIIQEQGIIRNLEANLRIKKGPIVTTLFSTEVINMKGEPHLLCVVKDISDRKRMEERLQRSQQEKLDILESITDGFFAIDSEWRFTFVNRAAETTLGIPRQALIGRKYHEVFTDSNHISWREYTKVMQEKIPNHYECFAPAVQKWFEVSVYPSRNGISVYFRDIQERKAAAEQQHLNIQRLEMLHKLNMMGGSTLQEIYNFACQQGVRLTGSQMGCLGIFDSDMSFIELQSYARNGEDYIDNGMTLFNIADAAMWTEAIRQRCAIIVNNYTTDNLNKKGSPIKRPILKRFLAVPVFTDDTVVAMAMVANKPSDYDESDIFQLKLLSWGIWEIVKKREEAEKLILSEERFNTAFNSSPDMMAIVSVKNYSLIEANQKFLEVIEYVYEEAVGHTLAELNLWLDPENNQPLLPELLKRGKFNNEEFNIYTRSGKIRTVLASIEMINISAEICLLVVMQDITEQKDLQNELIRLDRLNLVGGMAASIGHEIRNPMTAVRGFLQMFQDKYSEDREFLDLMIEELDRANSIITEFISLAKNKIVELTPQSLNSIMKNILPILRANAAIQDKCIKLEMEHLPDILLDEKEIRQLVLNLINNALESMPAGGGIIKVSTFMEENQVVLSIQDQGLGIQADILDKLGTPFFSTKEQGTGLGLAVCYGIAERHNARIDIETSKRGTTFYVRFPMIANDIAKNFSPHLESKLR
jgi:PAS domain S-box-containing protein